MIKAIDRHKIATIQTDTIMRYDANSNLVYDADRGISIIKYNILNLPDIIQFVNGNQIVNLYDAAGRKYKSIAYTVPATAGTSHYEIEHYTFATDTVEYITTEYSGNTELCYTRTDTVTQRIHNAIGYYSDSTYYHYIKDHLGNICVVIHSIADSAVQSTKYYASGIPMAESSGRDEQPYLYNGKEFVEAHGLNEYDSKARHYYATIMRTTTMDPMCESYYHISPYAWCGSNPIRHIDEDGQYYFDWDDWCYRSTYTNDEVSWSEVLRNEFVEPKPQKIMGARWLVLEWARGNGGNSRNFCENDNLTQQFITNNPRLEELRKKIADAIANGIESGEVDPENEKGDKYNFKLSEQENKPLIAAHDFLNFISNGKTGNVAMSVMGSYTIQWKVINRNQEGNAIVRITASNPMSVKSLIRPISDKGYSDFYMQKVSPIIDRIFSKGVGPSNYFANQNQTFTWTETIPQK